MSSRYRKGDAVCLSALGIADDATPKKCEEPAFLQGVVASDQRYPSTVMVHWEGYLSATHVHPDSIVLIPKE